MQILVITGCNLRFNFSAGLSHAAYIRGLIALGNEVDLLCYSDEDVEIDEGIELPNIRNTFGYYSVSKYEKMAKKKHDAKEKNDSIKETKSAANLNIKTKTLRKAKRIIRTVLYGTYGTYKTWYNHAKRFCANIEYDIVISMSDPPISHKMADSLIKKHHIIAKRWIQLWEDPWALDLAHEDEMKFYMKQESKLLDAGEEIVYVTPVTLLHQQELFSGNRDKMRWCPLAAYYQAEIIDYSNYTINCYGYFGDYSPDIRNLEPFYNVAVEKNLNVDICGSPSDLFSSKNNVKIYPRLPLGELKVHENKANVVICLFNLGGGQIPGKIYQLAATNKTILAILDGPEDEQKIIRDFFEKYNRFVFCQNNEQSISEAIYKIENNDLGGISNEPIDDFSVEKVAKMLLGD